MRGRIVIIAGADCRGDCGNSLFHSEHCLVAGVGLGNPCQVLLEIIEVQSGDYIGEDEIVRFDDCYGRGKALKS